MSDIRAGKMYDTPIGEAWAAPLWSVSGIFRAKIDFRCGHCGKINERVRPFIGYPTAYAVCRKCDEANFFPLYSKPGKKALTINSG